VVTRGQIWECVVGSRIARVLVVSNDEFNNDPDLAPWGLAVGPKPGVPSGLLVELRGTDPLPGRVVYVPNVLRVDSTSFRANLGFVGEATMTAVELALRDFLALP
jgi:mRNA interferase MazF